MICVSGCIVAYCIQVYSILRFGLILCITRDKIVFGILTRSVVRVYGRIFLG